MASAMPLLLLGGAALLFAGGGRRRGSKSKVSTASLSGGLKDAQAWAEWVEATGALPGFSAFAPAVAYTESGGKNLVGLGIDYGAMPPNVKLRTGTKGADNEAKAACNLWKGAVGRGYYGDNPYDWRYWCFGSGGWFGFLPATGLSAGGVHGPFADQSPHLVFEPLESVVMLADFVKRVIRNPVFKAMPPVHQNWLAVRRGMAASSLIDDYNEEHERSPGTRERFDRALAETGTDPDFMWERAEEGDYPGATHLLDWLYDNSEAA